MDRRRTGRNFHRRIIPCRQIDAEAIAVRGIRDADAADAPKFTEIMDELIAFVRDSSLVIHNAPFDLAFLNMELSLAGWPRPRSEEHTSELQSLMRSSYAVFCLKKKIHLIAKLSPSSYTTMISNICSLPIPSRTIHYVCSPL